MRSIGIFLTVAVLAIGSWNGRAQTQSSFLYQGQLQQNNVAANGTYDLEFSLWDSESEGRVLGVTTQNAMVVQQGSINALLDFGPEVFNGEQRWLQVSVDGQILVPRQPISRSPYSIQTARDVC